MGEVIAVVVFVILFIVAFGNVWTGIADCRMYTRARKGGGNEAKKG